MGEHFGVGFGAELVSLVLEHLLEGQVVLDDAVLDNHYVACAVAVGMGVGLVYLAVGGPARVADAFVPFEGAIGEDLLQVAQLASTTAQVYLAVMLHGDARRVVASILKITKPFVDDAGRLSWAYI